MARQRSSQQSSRANNKAFILIVSGISASNRWQEFKDGVRDLGVEHLSQSHVDSVNGVNLGYITITDEGEARGAYEKIMRHGWSGLRVEVGLFLKKSGLGENGNLEAIRRRAWTWPPTTPTAVNGRHGAYPTSYGLPSPPASPGHHNGSSRIYPQQATPAMMQWAQYWFTMPAFDPHPSHITQVPVITPQHSSLATAYSRQHPVITAPHLVAPQQQTSLFNTSAYTHRHAPRSDTYCGSEPTHYGYNHLQSTAARPSSSRHDGYETAQPSVAGPSSSPNQPSLPSTRAPVQNKTLFIQGLPFDLSDRKFKELLNRCAKLESYRLNMNNRKDKNRGSGTATFVSSTEALKAYEQLDGLDFCRYGRKLTVRWDKEGGENIKSTSTSSGGSGSERDKRRRKDKGKGKAGEKERGDDDRGNGNGNGKGKEKERDDRLKSPAGNLTIVDGTNRSWASDVEDDSDGEMDMVRRCRRLSFGS